MRTEQNFVLVQLRHYDHARTFVQWALGGGVLHAKDIILVYEQEVLFLAEVVTCELTHVLGIHRYRGTHTARASLVLAHGHRGFGLGPNP